MSSDEAYSILGLRPGATDEEVKHAYKLLAKKYHPDVAGNDPSASKKMQEINEAYDAIINHKTSEYGYGYGGERSSGSGGDDEPIELKAAASYINSGRYREALNALSGVPRESRSAKWYYYSSVAKAYSGDSSGALSDISSAISMDPTNPQYQSFLDALRNGRTSYAERRSAYAPSGNDRSCCTCCIPLMLLNLCFPGYFCIC